MTTCHDDIAPSARVSTPGNARLENFPIPRWGVSSYELISSGTSATVHFDHPNGMGATESSGLLVEKSRFARFRGRYISKELHEAAMKRNKGLLGVLFRCLVPAGFLELCKNKTCFRKEDLSFDLPNRQGPILAVNGVLHAVQRSQATVVYVKKLYGDEIADDIDLGFSKPFPLVELRESCLDLPRVADVCGLKDDTAPGAQHMLSIVVSYRHTTPKRGYILNVEPHVWPDIVSTVATLCEAASLTVVRIWTDQILSYRKPSAALRWVSSGVLPYAIFPVLYVGKGPGAVAADLRRMWISVEHLMATMGQGLVHAGPVLSEEELPLEWPTTYIDVPDGNVTWMVGMGMPLQGAVRKLCGAVMCGLVRNKEMSWAADAQDLVDWASAISSALLYRDIAHSFDCNDCRMPVGYTSGQRMMALLSSAVVIMPESENTLFNEVHPRLDVPAVAISLNAKSWDGFREWVPESCLWGAREDELKRTRADLVNATDVLVTSQGGHRALAILQMSRTDMKRLVTTAHMLVGLTDVQMNGKVARVEWSKRFWPLDPLKMWKSFAAVQGGYNTAAALKEFAVLVGASSGIDYTDISESTKVTCFKANCIQWM